jgi:hypothetical protein
LENEKKIQIGFNQTIISLMKTTLKPKSYAEMFQINALAIILQRNIIGFGEFYNINKKIEYLQFKNRIEKGKYINF